MACYGTTLPAFEGVFCATPRELDGSGITPPLRRDVDHRMLGAGELVACSGGVLYAGYEGAASRTWRCGGAADAPRAVLALRDRWRTAVDAMVEACRPGTAPEQLRDTWVATGEPLPPVLLAHGVGLGVEPPIVGGSLGPTAAGEPVLHAGMVLVLQGYVWEPGVGGYLGSETVHVTADGAVTLSRIPDPLAGERQT
jgi:Xaa-Pro aminopeptidase